MTELEILLKKVLQNKLDGHATFEEEQLIEHWLNEIEKLPSFVDDLDIQSIKRQSYLDLINQIQAQSKNRRYVNAWKRWSSIAAVFILVVFSTYYLFFHRSDKFILATIKPGKDTAQFINSDGQSFAFNNSKSLKSPLFLVQNGIIKFHKTSFSSNGKSNKLKTPFGGQFQIELTDGSRVWLNAGSEINFPNQFDSSERVVEVYGEAYFEVAHNPKWPFKVKSKNNLIEVLGTHFNVQNYPDEMESSVTLLEGKIQYSKNNYTQILAPGQQIISNQDKIHLVEVDTSAVVDWKNGDFYLGGQDYRALLRKMARWYNFNISYLENAPKALELGGWISRNQSLQSILEKLSLTNKIHFKIDGKHVTVSK
jgi:transmembrane sensor